MLCGRGKDGDLPQGASGNVFLSILLISSCITLSVSLILSSSGSYDRRAMISSGSQGLSLCSKHGVRVFTSTRSEHNLGNLSCSSVMRFERKAVVGREAEEGYLLGRI